MKIVTYHGPRGLRDEFLRVTDVVHPEQVYGMDIVGIYPDEDIIPSLGVKYRVWDAIRDRIFSRASIARNK